MLRSLGYLNCSTPTRSVLWGAVNADGFVDSTADCMHGVPWGAGPCGEARLSAHCGGAQEHATRGGDRGDGQRERVLRPHVRMRCVVM